MPLKEIRYCSIKVLALKQARIKEKSEPEYSVTEQIWDYQKESEKTIGATYTQVHNQQR